MSVAWFVTCAHSASRGCSRLPGTLCVCLWALLTCLWPALQSLANGSCLMACLLYFLLLVNLAQFHTKGVYEVCLGLWLYKGSGPSSAKIQCVLISQVIPEDSADQSQGLRVRNTGADVRFELEGTNCRVNAAFVDCTGPEWERTSPFWRARFDSVMENETWLAWNVQLGAKLCPLLLPLRLGFSNCFMFFAFTVSINYCRSQAGRSQAMEQWRRSKAVVMEEPDCKCKPNPTQLFVPSNVK